MSFSQNKALRNSNVVFFKPRKTDAFKVLAMEKDFQKGEIVIYTSEDGSV